ncbi:hypothetical protein LTR62_008223 [Meristemomyces frigidus]|uniref:Uncharacterized protein n=1 Tax=Meristemomyces frigidus TaxID=1508187 RepID=A0AAN7TDU3_9PEZI|nr:hypothetical protein LTR62_008223 [Meristemomyces frigidus]
MADPNNLVANTAVIAPPDQYFANAHYAPINGQAVNGSVPLTPAGSIPPTPGSLAGRKRSRGDIYEADEEEEFADGAVGTTFDGSGYAAATAMQSSASAQEQAAGRQFDLTHVKRPSFSSRKSQRKVADADGDYLAQLVLPPQMREATAEPLIDEATRVLGISWTRMDSSEVLQINKAAYSKWIQNHYPRLTDVAVWFENSALPGYLVEARNIHSGQQGFYIFSHDLTEARLVTTEPDQLMPRLKMLPALHLAAPGGHLRAEMDVKHVSTVQQEESNSVHAMVDGAQADDVAAGASEPNGMCSAHQMELD